MAGELARYRVLFLPFTCAISDELADALLEWVKGGGTLIADVRLAITDEHGAPRDDALLERLMGVRRTRPEATYELADVSVAPDESFQTSVRETIEATGDATVGARYDDGTPAIVRREVGEGRTIYLNFLLPKYDPVVVATVDRLLADAGVERRVTVTAADADSTPRAWECARYELGEAEIVGLIRDHRLCDEPQTCRVNFGRVAHIYDMRARRYLGHTDAAVVTLAPGEAACFAVLPYRVTGIRLVATGNQARCTVLTDGRTGDHVLHVSVTDPAGNPAPAYTKNVLAPDGVAELMVPLVANDPAGQWTLTVRDVLSGTMASTTFDWQPE